MSQNTEATFLELTEQVANTARRLHECAAEFDGEPGACSEHVSAWQDATTTLDTFIENSGKPQISGEIRVKTLNDYILGDFVNRSAHAKGSNPEGEGRISVTAAELALMFQDIASREPGTSFGFWVTHDETVHRDSPSFSFDIRHIKLCVEFFVSHVSTEVEL